MALIGQAARVSNTPRRITPSSAPFFAPALGDVGTQIVENLS